MRLVFNKWQIISLIFRSVICDTFYEVFNKFYSKNILKFPLEVQPGDSHESVQGPSVFRRRRGDTRRRRSTNRPELYIVWVKMNGQNGQSGH